MTGVQTCALPISRSAGEKPSHLACAKAAKLYPHFPVLLTYISLCKYNFQCRPAIAKIIKRSLLLIFIGLVMEWFITAIDSGNYFDLSQLRLMGVMQRLGICYGITALLAVTIPHKRFMPTILSALFSNPFPNN